MANRPKVFCIGFQKTGTTSLYAALTDLGYHTASVIGRDLTADELHDQGAKLCLEAAETFDAVQDMPWPLFFRELDEKFPGSKFILTVRDADGWFSSIEKHFGNEPDEMQAFIYGKETPFPEGHKNHYLDVIHAHNEAVKTYFAGRQSDLLVMDLAKGDAWGSLCDFLGCPVPNTPFPVRNKASDRETFSYRVRRKLMRIFGAYLAPEKI